MKKIFFVFFLLSAPVFSAADHAVLELTARWIDHLCKKERVKAAGQRPPMRTVGHIPFSLQDIIKSRNRYILHFEADTEGNPASLTLLQGAKGIDILYKEGKAYKCTHTNTETGERWGTSNGWCCCSGCEDFANQIATQNTRHSIKKDPAFHATEHFKSGKQLGPHQKIRASTPPPSPPSKEDTDELGRTALHEAASKGNFQKVQRLVESNANVCARTHHGDTPLSIAQRKGFNNIARYLADKNEKT